MTTERVVDAVAGGEVLPQSTVEKIGALADKLDKATEIYKNDKTDLAAKARDEAAIELTELKKEHDAERAKADEVRQSEIDAMLAWAKTAREPSKAALFGNGSPFDQTIPAYEPGSFIHNLFARKSDEFSLTGRMKAEQNLERMGVRFLDLPTHGEGASKGTLAGPDPQAGGPSDRTVGRGGFQIPQLAVEYAAAEMLRSGQLRTDQYSSATGYDPIGNLKAKATLGLTGATGGVLIPGAAVGDLVKPGVYRSATPRLVKGRNVNSYTNLIPTRATTPTRAAVVAWGDTKTNTNLAYGSYTATMYTMAIIYDLAKQFIRYSNGAAEQDVISELATAFELGKAYYILQGSGSSEPYGVQTAIATAFSAYTTSFTASATTLAGSVGKALATAAGDLAVRNRNPEAALVGAAAYWNMISQGTDTAGFFMAPSGGPLSIRVDGLGGGASPWGIPVYPETQLAGTDDLLVGEWSALEVFYGDTYRVDTSDEAGDRWDKNLVGFRGEQEIGLDARAAVFAGAFQFIADIAP